MLTVQHTFNCVQITFLTAHYKQVMINDQQKKSIYKSIFAHTPVLNVYIAVHL